MRFMCATASTERLEPMVGTASTVRSFLLVQQEGPWGIDALHDSRLPSDVATALTLACRTAGVRPLLIRRHGHVTGRTRVFAARADATDPWLETALLDDVDEVLDIDLGALGRGHSTGMDRVDESVFLVCTNGSHDLCCAAFGRPLAKVLMASHPDQAWEVSHIGGDRFAGNLVVLPDGLYYGRVTPQDGPRIVQAHLDGHLDLAHLRGRSSHSFAVQAAEHHLRLQTGLTGLGDVVLVAARRDDDLVTATFAAMGRSWSVVVRAVTGEPAVLTCRSTGPNRPRHHELVAVEQI